MKNIQVKFAVMSLVVKLPSKTPYFGSIWSTPGKKTWNSLPQPLFGTHLQPLGPQASWRLLIDKNMHYGRFWYQSINYMGGGQRPRKKSSYYNFSS